MKRKKEGVLIFLGILFLAFAGGILWLQSKNNTSVAPLMYTMAAADGIFGLVMFIIGVRGVETEESRNADILSEFDSMDKAPARREEPQDDPFDDGFDDGFENDVRSRFAQRSRRKEPEEDEGFEEKSEFEELIAQSERRVEMAKKSYKRAFDNASDRMLDLEDAEDEYENSGASDEAAYELSRAKRAAAKADEKLKAAEKELKEARNELERLKAME